jgi:cytochrome d ubiquinol oxidase subunit I
MVGIAFIMLFVVVAGQVLQLRGRLWDSVWFLRLCQWVAPLGFIAVVAGWTTTEVGRQPWTVYGLLRTADSVSPSLTGADVALSLAFYVVVYLIMFPTGIAFMAGLVRRGPQEEEVQPEMVESGRPTRPFESAARAGSGS